MSEEINQLDDYGNPIGKWDGMCYTTYYKGVFTRMRFGSLRFTGYCKSEDPINLLSHPFGWYEEDGSLAKYCEYLHKLNHYRVLIFS